MDSGHNSSACELNRYWYNPAWFHVVLKSLSIPSPELLPCGTHFLLFTPKVQLHRKTSRDAQNHPFPGLCLCESYTSVFQSTDAIRHAHGFCWMSKDSCCSWQTWAKSLRIINAVIRSSLILRKKEKWDEAARRQSCLEMEAGASRWGWAVPCHYLSGS